MSMKKKADEVDALDGLLEEMSDPEEDMDELAEMGGEEEDESTLSIQERLSRLEELIGGL